MEQKLLYKHWVHSHEEDSKEEKIFRPDDYKFPPSRGRESFELKADGTLLYYGLSPVDKRDLVKGRWEIKDNYLLLYPKMQHKPDYSLEILTINKDKLVVKK